MPDFRRGIEAIKAAQESSKGGGDFKPWVPQIQWKDGDEKYLLFLNPMDEVPLVSMHEWVPVGQGEKADGTKFDRYEWFIARTDPAIGEDSDPLTEKGSDPKDKNLAVAVELEPIMTTVKGRPRPKGFEVKTQEYERRVRDDDGELTDETETVVTPVIGVVMQSPHNFFGYLSSYQETDGPVNETPFKVKRRGGDQNTAYDFTPYVDQDVDLSKIVEFVDGISYLNDYMDELVETLDGLDSEEAAAVVATTLLDARLDELADGERYDELTGEIEEIKSKYGKKSKGESKSNAKPERKSQRSRAKSRSSAKAETDEPEKSSQEDPARMDKFKELRERSARKREATSA